MPEPGPLDLGWSLCDRLSVLFGTPFDPLFAAVDGATDVEAVLAAADPESFRHACSKGLDAIVDEGSNPVWPPAVRVALAGLRGDVEQLLGRFDPTARLLGSAADRVRGLRLPRGGWAGFFKGAGEAATVGTAVNFGAVGGATLGSLVLPGVGAAVGGALGAYLGRLSGEGREKATVEEYDRALGHVRPALTEMFAAAWDLIADRVRRHGGASLPSSAQLGQAEDAWGVLFERMGEGEPWCADAKQFVARYGPHPQVLRGLILVRLSCGDRGAEVDGWLTTMLRLYPERAESAECEAAVLFVRESYAAAADAAARGLARAPEHGVLKLARVEALAAAGRGREVDHGGWLGTDPEAWLAYVRGACRAGDLDAAAAAVRAWKATGADVRGIDAAIRSDEIISPRADALAARVRGNTPAPPAAGRPTGAEPDPARLRGELVRNLWDGAARTRYLAARTPEQQQQDEDSAPRRHGKPHETAIVLGVLLLFGFVGGWFGALAITCAVVGVVVEVHQRVRHQQLRGIARMFGPLPQSVSADESEARNQLFG